ncbi:MAG TPA: universal stress protein [Nitrososphaerales archaeon]|nr:universal stress protein [Nitrososphaerales archaeon]
MSTTVTLAKNQKQQNERLEEKPSDDEWSSIVNVLGYPKSWAEPLRERVESSGKTWHWTSISDQQALLLKKQESTFREKQVPQNGRLLLIINSKTPERAVRNALLLAEDTGARISLVYTAVPRLVSDGASSSEVDWEFTSELSRGRARLESISSEARKLGIESETHFEWDSQPAGVSKKYMKSTADLVIDETA